MSEHATLGEVLDLSDSSVFENGTSSTTPPLECCEAQRKRHSESAYHVVAMRRLPAWKLLLRKLSSNEVFGISRLHSKMRSDGGLQFNASK